MEYPHPNEIQALASSMGYKERRPEVSSTLFFEEIEPGHGKQPILINVFYTTRSLMTYLHHPKMGTNQLWRSNAYNDLEDLHEFFENPRRHGGKGYRNKNKAIRGCVQCGEYKERKEFSKNQWVVKGPDQNKCKDCVDRNGLQGFTNSSEVDKLVEPLGEMKLTTDSLERHNQAQEAKNLNNKQKTNNKNGSMDRRQFNCPNCPRHGRGKFTFFKKVSTYKPMTKCPKCKIATQGKCSRLYPIPKESEKGYGLFLCNAQISPGNKCPGKWGSSRAVNGIGQQCYECKLRGEVKFVKPFRLEIVKTSSKNGGGISGSGKVGGGRMHRVPKEPIVESEELDLSYTSNDFERNKNAGANALVNSNHRFNGSRADVSSRSNSSYNYETVSDNSSIDTEEKTTTTGYTHYCEGCATGICRSRYLPKSQVHSSDGDTASTSGSIMTNSSIDKGEFLDRDEDFFDFEEEEDV